VVYHNEQVDVNRQQVEWIWGCFMGQI